MASIASAMLLAGLGSVMFIASETAYTPSAAARRTESALPPPVDRPILAAALLHDVGKISSNLGPVRRALATLAGMAASHDAATGWRARSGPIGRAGRYLCHDAIGADLLAGVGSDDLTVAWAREHHLPPDRWSVPTPVGAPGLIRCARSRCCGR